MTREIVEITHKGVKTISKELNVILGNIVEKIKIASNSMDSSQLATVHFYILL